MKKAAKLIFGILSQNAEVTAICEGTQIFPVVVPQTAVYPCVRFNVISVVPSDTKGGVSGTDIVRVQIDSFAQSDAGDSGGAGFDIAGNLDAAVRTALDRFAGTVNGVTTDGIRYLSTTTTIDEEDDVFGFMSDYQIRIKN